MRLNAIQWIHDAQFVAADHLLSYDLLFQGSVYVGCEAELVDDMTKVVVIRVFQIWYLFFSSDPQPSLSLQHSLILSSEPCYYGKTALARIEDFLQPS